jgi:hypothetical protein
MYSFFFAYQCSTHSSKNFNIVGTGIPITQVVSSVRSKTLPIYSVKMEENVNHPESNVWWVLYWAACYNNDTVITIVHSKEWMPYRTSVIATAVSRPMYSQERVGGEQRERGVLVILHESFLRSFAIRIYLCTSL